MWSVFGLGHNDTFAYGGYLFSNVSAGGPVMTLDVERDPNPSTLESLKFRWFKNDPDVWAIDYGGTNGSPHWNLW